MTDSSGSQDPVGPDTVDPDTVGLNAAGLDRRTREASFAPAPAAQYSADTPAFPPTETVEPRPAGDTAWGHAPAGPSWPPRGETAPSDPPAGSAASAGQAGYQPDPGGYPEMRRYGPGVPSAGPGVLSADEI